ncbi:MAG: transglycosylase domain-containing protein [Chloroflexales bacterium]|nr:transglycosylase domain-containing protein [Chloroflexales bacterium]
MLRNRHTRRTYAGNTVPRRPMSPGMMRRNRTGGSSAKLPRIVTMGFTFLALSALICTAVLGTGVYSAYAQIAASLKPRLEAMNNRQVFQTSRIYDRHGTLLYEFFDAGRRTKISLNDVSPLLINATIAIEDKTFFTNPGVDVEGIIRTIYSSIRAGEETGGASTISQQVIKGIIFTDEERLYENRYERKLKEIILAQELSQRYSKEAILELYLNEIFYGNLAYGIEAASRTFFKTAAKDLNLAQASLLAGLPQSPSTYNPINFLERDEQGSYLPGVSLPAGDAWLSSDASLPNNISPPRYRQIAVLRQMVDEGYATEAQARAALTSRIRFAPQEVPLNAPHFVFYVRDLLERKYGQQLVSDGGLNIYTTLDLDMQRMIQQKAADHIAELEVRNIHNAAVVVMQPNTGQILAMVGSIDYNAVKPSRTPGETGNVLDGQVNVTTRERQPGSALKPFTYLAAMERGMTPATVLWDVPTQFPLAMGEWYAPQNYNGRWNGPVRIRTALANSLNMPAVKALKYAGIDYTLKLLDRVGIKEGLKRGEGFYGLSLTLGGGEVTPLELTTAYNTLASDGRYYPPISILRITDGNGQILEAYTPSAGQQVIEPALNSLISDILSDDQARAAIWGLNSQLKLSRPAAVKTGTTNDWRDAWAAGYTPYLTVGVWTGNNNNEPTAKVESLSGGGIIWRNVMEELFKWMDTNPRYRDLFTAPFPDRLLPINFELPKDQSIARRSICLLPGPFGGYDTELFTRSMTSRTTTLTSTQDISSTQSVSQTNQFCDAYEELTVIRLPDTAETSRIPVFATAPLSDTQAASSPNYCLPQDGQEFDPEALETVYIWNTPPPTPGERVEYRWAGGEASALRSEDIPDCTPDLLALLKPPEPQPPIPGAVLMPDLFRLGENQAKELLNRLGVNQIYVDYQGRNRIPDVYDQFLPYTVVSTLPRSGEWIIPGTTVVLGIRAPDPESAPADATPQPAPADTTLLPVQPAPGPDQPPANQPIPILPPDVQP